MHTAACITCVLIAKRCLAFNYDEAGLELHCYRK